MNYLWKAQRFLEYFRVDLLQMSMWLLLVHFPFSVSVYGRKIVKCFHLQRKNLSFIHFQKFALLSGRQYDSFYQFVYCFHLFVYERELFLKLFILHKATQATIIQFYGIKMHQSNNNLTETIFFIVFLIVKILQTLILIKKIFVFFSS